MTSIGIIGSGFGAIATAVELKRAGHTDLRIWERSDDIGGVWRDNTYPGAACDVPSPLYSFSFEPNPHWSYRYAQQPEIHAYLKATADKYGITPLIQLATTVEAAHFDEATSSWTVTFAGGHSEQVDLLISAVGQLSRPVLPTIPGLDSFDGPSFHSAQWDHSFDPTGKRVAVIGTGASAIQFVPHLAERASALTVFQRTPAYILPKPDHRYGAFYKRVLRHVPGALRAERSIVWGLGEQFSRSLEDDSTVGAAIKRVSLAHLRRKVTDPDLQAKLTPDYPVGCKRILFSNNYYPALQRPGVELVTEPISAITPQSVVTADGAEHEVDALVIGTGFNAQDFLDSIDIVGTEGQKLSTQWADGARAYLGIYAPNFPNFFVVYGPNTNLGGGSIIFMLEAQARHVRQAVDRLRRHHLDRVEISVDAAEDFDRDVQHQLEHSVWAHCESWYRHPSGRITSNWPGATGPYARRSKTLSANHFHWS